MLPTELTYGRVVGQVILAVADSGDVDRLPDSRPATGTITLTPKVQQIRGTTPAPVLVVSQPIQCSLDEAGHLIDPNVAATLNALPVGQRVAAPEDRGVWLVTGAYTVKYSIPSAAVATHDIDLTPTHTEVAPLDLLTALPPGGPVLTASQYAEVMARIDEVESSGGTGGGAVDSVNGQTGAVVLAAADVGALPDTYSPDLTGYVTSTDPRLSDARTPTAHAHAIGDVTGLQGELDGKQPAGSYATAAQGALADTAVQPAALDAYATEQMLVDGLATKAATGIAGLPAGSVVRAYWTGAAWPARPTARTDISVEWVGGTDAAPPTAGVAGVDTWMRETV